MRTADPRTHYIELDALRGLAVLSVVGQHIAAQWNNAPNVFGGPPPELTLTIPFLGVDALDVFFLGGLGFTSLGGIGVFLFFLLSG
jgi:peptidoglycan/LPS O-acetylase OafA/YrhL